MRRSETGCNEPQRPILPLDWLPFIISCNCIFTIRALIAIHFFAQRKSNRNKDLIPTTRIPFLILPFVRSYVRRVSLFLLAEKTGALSCAKPTLYSAVHKECLWTVKPLILARTVLLPATQTKISMLLFFGRKKAAARFSLGCVWQVNFLIWPFHFYVTKTILKDVIIGVMRSALCNSQEKICNFIIPMQFVISTLRHA